MAKKILSEYVDQKKIKGTVHIRCPECGAEFFYNVREHGKWVVCKNCGENFFLDKMRRGVVEECPYCEKYHKFLTNSREQTVTIGCLRTVNDTYDELTYPQVDCFWNKEKKVYEYIE